VGLSIRFNGNLNENSHRFNALGIPFFGEEDMRIAYSCAGEGFGHAARMVVLSKILEGRHHVRYFVPKNIQPFLREKLSAFSAEDISYFSYVKYEDRVDLLQTALGVLPQIGNFPREVSRLAERLKSLRIEAVISDFEPYLARAGRKAGIPVFQINHPGIVAKLVSPDPRSWLPALGARLLEGPWDERVHISFFGGDAGPLFRPSLFRYPVTEGDYVVFNLKDSYKTSVAEVLKRFPTLDARIFPRPGGNFEEALAGCRAVVSSAGHQIIAESMALGKPILVLPQKGQWEQLLNARMLEKAGSGISSSIKNLHRDLPKFLDDLDRYRTPPKLPRGFTVEDGTAVIRDRLEGFLRTCDPSADGEIVIPERTGRNKTAAA
jgi:UDP:flavonoid glycosyltransferase YjiC (YdhE family)